MAAESRSALNLRRAAGVRRAAAVLALGGALALAGALAPAAGADDPPLPEEPAVAVPGELLVRFEPGTAAGERAEVRQRQDTPLERTLPLPGLQLVQVGEAESVSEAAARLEREPSVMYAEPNLRRSVSVTPNDPYLPYLWGLQSTGQTVAGQSGAADADVDGPEAWELSTGSSSVTVAVIDSGVDHGHPDLAANIWRNAGESGAGRESNGADDDGNGLADDWRGWDWVARDNDPQDLNGHGTHVAGTIAARGDDGAGVVGVSWSASLMPLRVLDANGSGSVASLISAYGYARRAGARIVNASLGGAGYSQAESDAIAAARGTLFVIAAGNGGADGIGDDNDSTPEYPCGYSLDNIVCVAASNRYDGLASFSNFGAGSVDLAAPGVDVLSTQPGGRYAYYDGTSMATPHAAGAAALVFARTPALTPTDVKGALLRGAEPQSAFAGRTVSGGRLNAARAIAAATGGPQPEESAPAPAPAPASAPAPPPVTATPRDTLPPLVSLAPRVPRMATLLARGARVRVGCSEACELRATLSVAATSATRLGLARAAVLGRGNATLSGAGRAVLTVRLSRRARRALSAARSVRLELRVRAVDRAGNVRTALRPLTVRR